MIELKRCPFCGGEAFFRRPRDVGSFEAWSIECRDCAAIPYEIKLPRRLPKSEKQDAIAHLWNRRSEC